MQTTLGCCVYFVVVPIENLWHLFSTTLWKKHVFASEAIFRKLPLSLLCCCNSLLTNKHTKQLLTYGFVVSHDPHETPSCPSRLRWSHLTSIIHDGGDHYCDHLRQQLPQLLSQPIETGREGGEAQQNKRSTRTLNDAKGGVTVTYTSHKPQKNKHLSAHSVSVTHSINYTSWLHATVFRQKN